MIDINNNNELAKPMAKNGDDIYSANSKSQDKNNPYEMQNTNTYPVAQKQIIIIEQGPQISQNVHNYLKSGASS